MKYILNIFIALFIAVQCFSTNISAETAADIVFLNVDDGRVVSYINCAAEDLTASIGSVQCEDIFITSTEDENTNTLILIDTSGSVRDDMQNKIKEITAELIDEKSEKEHFAIAELGTEISLVCDYTSDRYELSKSMQNIAFDKKNTYIYSSLDNALDSIDSSIFTKVIVFSDGLENNNDGITYDEILKKVTDSHCPIYTVGFGKNNDSLKKFFAFSRNSYGQSFVLDTDTTASEVCEAINETRSYTCVDIKIPADLSDGSIKYLMISGNDFQCGADVRMPVNIADEDTPENEPDDVFLDEDLEESYEYTAAPENNSSKYIYIIVIGVLIIVIAVAAFFIRKSKKAKSDAEKVISEYNDEQTIIENEPSTLIGGSCNDDCTVRFTDVNSPERSFRCALGNGIKIGRDPSCMVVINYDGYVSRVHCFIFKQDGRFFVQNLSKTKELTINDKITVPKQQNEQSSETKLIFDDDPSGGSCYEIHDNDKIRLGHTTLIFEVLQ